MSTASTYMTHKQLLLYVYRRARLAGLTTDTADAVARHVTDRATHPRTHIATMAGDTLDRFIDMEVQRHAAP